VEELGGGNRGWGVGNEPSRSLRGSGVVARLLRSELSAEHLSLSRLVDRSAVPPPHHGLRVPRPRPAFAVAMSPGASRRTARTSPGSSPGDEVFGI
jgi:hypothetical protein